MQNPHSCSPKTCTSSQSQYDHQKTVPVHYQNIHSLYQQRNTTQTYQKPVPAHRKTLPADSNKNNCVVIVASISKFVTVKWCCIKANTTIINTIMDQFGKIILLMRNKRNILNLWLLNSSILESFYRLFCDWLMCEALKLVFYAIFLWFYRYSFKK